MDHRDDDVFDDHFDEQGNDREEQARSFLNIKFSVCDDFSLNTKSTSGTYCAFYRLSESNLLSAVSHRSQYMGRGSPKSRLGEFSLWRPDGGRAVKSYEHQWRE